MRIVTLNKVIHSASIKDQALPLKHSHILIKHFMSRTGRSESNANTVPRQVKEPYVPIKPNGEEEEYIHQEKNFLNRM